MPRIRPAYLACAILFTALLFAWFSSLGDSLVVDEVPHIGAGYSYVTQLDYRLNPEHPPLIKDAAGFMLTLLHLNQTAFTQPPWTTDVNGQWNFGRSLIFETSNNADEIKDFARIPALIVFAVGGWLVWKWSRERSGDRAGLIALILYSFSPTLLAHGHLVTTDVPAAVTILATTYCFIRFLRDQSRANFVWATVTLGLALLAKFNTVLIGPFFLIIAAFYDWRTLWKTAALGIAAVFLVVCPVYIIQTLHYPVARHIADTQSILHNQPTNLLKALTLWTVTVAPLRPLAQWLLGLTMVYERAVGGNSIYWLGNVVNSGGPWYFPIVYFIKEPLAWFVLCALAVIAAWQHKKHMNRGLEEGSWLLWLGLYWAVSITSNLNIGIRHLLPTYPFAIMLVSGVVGQIKTRRASIVIALLLGWYVFSSVAAFPNYISYFNELAGGPSGGYRYVVDSNVDWGQDAKRLGQWADAQGMPRLCLDYFGWADPAYYLRSKFVWSTVAQWKDRADFVRHNTCGGWLAISATYFQNSVGIKKDSPGSDERTYRWLLNDKPLTVIGNSIFVWHLQ